MSATQVRPFKLKRPCKNCPFRSDIPKYLREERVQEIADSLYDGAEFPCHETTEHVEGPDGWEERIAVPTSAFCAGALITMEKEGYSNQMVRIGERLGMFNVDDLIMDSPVYDSLEEWVASFRQIPTVTITNSDGTTETLEYEHCGVVAEDCEDPPGFAMGGGVARSTAEPTCNPIEDCCTHCGTTMCTACRAEDTEDGYPQCKYCAEDQDEDEG